MREYTDDENELARTSLSDEDKKILKTLQTLQATANWSEAKIYDLLHKKEEASPLKTLDDLVHGGEAKSEYELYKRINPASKLTEEEYKKYTEGK